MLYGFFGISRYLYCVNNLLFDSLSLIIFKLKGSYHTYKYNNVNNNNNYYYYLF